jgi:heavy metal translocating P-type ATPase
LLGRPLRSGDQVFCCEGCKRVWTAAGDNGFAELLSAPRDRAARTASASSRKAAAAAAAGARRETLQIGGMWCSSCALVLEDALLGVDGVLDAEVSYAASLARVTWDPERTDQISVVGRVDLLGYQARPARLAESTSRDAEDAFLRFFVGVAVGMWAVWPTLFLLYPAFVRGQYASVQRVEVLTGVFALVVLLYTGWPFLAGAWRAARVGRATMDTLVVLGTWTAWVFSAWATWSSSAPTYFESVAMIPTIVMLGRWIEALGQRDATRSLVALAQTEAAQDAWVVRAANALDETQRVPLETVTVGMLVAVRAGERVPVDGRIVSGSSELDLSRLTGEPLPATVGVNDEVWAGSINLAGTVVIRVERVGAETLSGRLASIAEDAVFAKSNVQRLVDRIAALFVPVVLATAAVTLLITGFSAGIAVGVSRAVAVLVVACPCALGLATPLAIANAVGAGARQGILIRGGLALERAGMLALVALDKTGTLTQGRPAVTRVLPTGDGPDAEDELLAVASGLEAGETHPVARAILEAARSRDVTPRAPSAAERIAGMGISGETDGRVVLAGSEQLLAQHGLHPPAALAESVARERTAGRIAIWVASDGRVLGALVLADPIRSEAAPVIEQLAARGVSVAVVSGDSQATTQSVADELGIASAYGEVMPHDKERVVAELGAALSADAHSDRAPTVAFVGDGINDAAALAASDLAVTVVDASDVAQLAADAVLLDAERPLAALPALVDLSRATSRIITQNLVWAFAYNAVTVPLAILGLLSPIAAAVAMALSSLAVVANSWRLQGTPTTVRTR